MNIAASITDMPRRTPNPLKSCKRCHKFRDAKDLFARSDAEICLLCQRKEERAIEKRKLARKKAEERKFKTEFDEDDVTPSGVFDAEAFLEMLSGLGTASSHHRLDVTRVRIAEALNAKSKPKLSDKSCFGATRDWYYEVLVTSEGEYEALGPYVSETRKTRILHTKCDYEFNVTPGDWRQGQRCWHCSAAQFDLSSELWRIEVEADIDRYRLLGEYTRSHNERIVEHERCLTKFATTPERWREGDRCIACPPLRGRMYTTRKWRREVIEDTAGEYRAIGDYVRPRGKTRVLHLACGWEWDVQPANWRARKSRCPQCAEPRTDNDAVYIWRKRDHRPDGRYVVKIGTTSWRLQHKRIKTVAAKHKTKAHVLAFEQVSPGSAVDVESRLLRIGEPLTYTKRVDGATEFRAVTLAELKIMLRLLNDAAIK